MMRFSSQQAMQPSRGGQALFLFSILFRLSSFVILTDCYIEKNIYEKYVHYIFYLQSPEKFFFAL